ncbi:MAG: hypothetical protein JSS00_04105 [Proteobacteria bacterium]|nr:hypothetical protein [Pseudomonadota bacterium]
MDDLSGSAIATIERESESLERQNHPAVISPFSELSRQTRRALVGGWLLFLAVLLLIFGGSAAMALTMGVVAAFVAVFLITPIILLRVSRRATAAKPSETVDTYSGPLTQHQALVQIALLPILLAVGMAFIGYLATHQG